MIFVDPVLRAGDEPALGVLGTLGENVVDHVPDGEVETVLGKKAAEQRVVITGRRLHLFRQVAGLQ